MTKGKEKKTRKRRNWVRVALIPNYSVASYFHRRRGEISGSRFASGKYYYVCSHRKLMRHESLTECPIQLRTSSSPSTNIAVTGREKSSRKRRAYIRQVSQVRAFLWAKKLLMETPYPLKQLRMVFTSIITLFRSVDYYIGFGGSKK